MSVNDLYPDVCLPHLPFPQRFRLMPFTPGEGPFLVLGPLTTSSRWSLDHGKWTVETSVCLLTSISTAGLAIVRTMVVFFGANRKIESTLHEGQSRVVGVANPPAWARWGGWLRRIGRAEWSETSKLALSFMTSTSIDSSTMFNSFHLELPESMGLFSPFLSLNPSNTGLKRMS